MKELWKKKSNKLIVGAIAVLVLLLILFLLVSGGAGKGAKSHIRLGDKYLSELDYEQAIAAYMAALEIDPKNREAKEKMERVCVEYADLLVAESQTVTLEQYYTAYDLMGESYRVTQLETVKEKQDEIAVLIQSMDPDADLESRNNHAGDAQENGAADGAGADGEDGAADGAGADGEDGAADGTGADSDGAVSDETGTDDGNNGGAAGGTGADSDGTADDSHRVIGPDKVQTPEEAKEEEEKQEEEAEKQREEQEIYFWEIINQDYVEQPAQVSVEEETDDKIIFVLTFGPSVMEQMRIEMDKESGDAVITKHQVEDWENGGWKDTNETDYPRSRVGEKINLKITEEVRQAYQADLEEQKRIAELGKQYSEDVVAYINSSWTEFADGNVTLKEVNINQMDYDRNEWYGRVTYEGDGTVYSFTVMMHIRSGEAEITDCSVEKDGNYEYLSELPFEKKVTFE